MSLVPIVHSIKRSIQTRKSIIDTLMMLVVNSTLWKISD